MSAHASRKLLERLLDTRNERPEQLHDIDAEIRARFEKTQTVFVLDMSGFSVRTIKYGIAHYLAMIRRMHTIVLPLVSAAKGRVVKTEADNVFALFANVKDALRAAESVNDALERVNAGLPADWDIHVGIGIGHGPLLVIGDDDVYGSEMNLASKLGEDVAGGGEVLLTEGAARGLHASTRKKMAKKSVKFAKHKLPYFVARAAKVVAKKTRKKAAKKPPTRR
jgi:adenylate cyclase